MRMFVAVRPPADAVEDLDGFLEVRREHAAFRWTAPEQWHVTLAFLPTVPERSLDDLVERLARAGRRRRPMVARIAGGGAFPRVSTAKVVWAGLDVDDSVELDRLATGCRAAANRAGATVDGQRFRAHITLARTGRPVEASNWVRLLDGYRGPAWPVDRLELVASHLGQGPRNTPRHEIVTAVDVGHG